MTGGRIKGVMPRPWKMPTQAEGRRHCDQVSGKAISTASAAARAAMTIDVRKAFRQPASAKIWTYQASEKPSGGNSSVFFSFTDTPATMTMGAAKKRPTARKNRRVAQPAL